MLEILLLLFLIAALMEFGAATLGMGYGTTLAPILILLGYAPLLIVPAILFSQFFAGSIAAMFHHAFKNMDLECLNERTALGIFTVTGIIGIIVSVMVSVSVPGNILGMYIAISVMIAGCLILLEKAQFSQFSRNRLVFIGSVAAFNKGLSGGGYGPIAITGQILSGIKPRAAIAIVALVEGIICAVGSLFYIILGVPMDFVFLFAITAGAITAAPLSAFTTKKLEHEHIKKIVGITTLIIGLITFLYLAFFSV